MTQSVLTLQIATNSDLEGIKYLADMNRDQLGFIPRSVFAAGIANGWVIVALCNEDVIGFVHFRPRRDGWTTIYEICIDASTRRQGVGRTLLADLYGSTCAQGRSGLRLKCPADNEANRFYAALGMEQVGTEAGKRRPLFVWQWVGR